MWIELAYQSGMPGSQVSKLENSVLGTGVTTHHFRLYFSLALKNNAKSWRKDGIIISVRGASTTNIFVFKLWVSSCPSLLSYLSSQRESETHVNWILVWKAEKWRRASDFPLNRVLSVKRQFGNAVYTPLSPCSRGFPLSAFFLQCSLFSLLNGYTHSRFLSC